MPAEHIISALQTALKKLEIVGVVPELEHPAELAHGDFSTNVALVAAKKAGANPRELAEKIVKELENISGVEKIEVAGAGFINFHLTREAFSESVQEILSAGEKWGSNASMKGKKIMYEYTDPNPFKVFHIGHLMSNAIGESLSRIGSFQGALVLRANYQGDVGLHVAKSIWGLLKNKLDPANVDDLGKAYVVGSTAYEEDATTKEEIDALNKKIYANDPEIKPIYDSGRKASLERFEMLYQILGTKFDYYFFESDVGPIGMKIVHEGLKKGIF